MIIYIRTFDKFFYMSIASLSDELGWAFVLFDTLYIHFTEHLRIKGTSWPTIFVFLVHKFFFFSPWFTNSHLIMGMMRHHEPLKLALSSITAITSILYCAPIAKIILCTFASVSNCLTMPQQIDLLVYSVLETKNGSGLITVIFYIQMLFLLILKWGQIGWSLHDYIF